MHLREALKGIPESHQPIQGGQQYFKDYLLKEADRKASLQAAAAVSNEGRSTDKAAADIRLPLSEYAERKRSVEETVAREMEELRRMDGFQTQRSYSDVAWYDVERQGLQPGVPRPPGYPEPGEAEAAGIEGPEAQEGGEGEESAVLPETRVLGDDYFKSRYGYSLLKKSTMPVTTNYNQIDLWAEQPKYHRDMFFMYCICRRRNVYAVMYNYEGKRVHHVATAGNRGFKGGARGLGGDGGADTAHQVTSQYLNECIPKLREIDHQKGIKREKYEIVVRVLGFYNGRSGALRAITDRSDVLQVRYLEDITPFPLNGPKLPTKMRRNANKV